MKDVPLSRVDLRDFVEKNGSFAAGEMVKLFGYKG